MSYQFPGRQSKIQDGKGKQQVERLAFCLLKGRLLPGALAIFFFLTFSTAWAEPPIWQVLLAEGVNQGYKGMFAIACVLRNRGGSLKGFAGAKRADLEAFCLRQGLPLINLAKRAQRACFIEGQADSTGGATHFENIEAFGTPYWTKSMVKTVKIGSHTFYKEKGHLK